MATVHSMGLRPASTLARSQPTPPPADHAVETESESSTPGETDRFKHENTTTNSFLYPGYEAMRMGQKAWFSAWSTAFGIGQMQTQIAGMMTPEPMKPLVEYTNDVLGANREFCDLMAKDYSKPEFGLNQTTLPGGETVEVKEKVVAETPFCKLLHFERDTDRNDPKALVVAPLSGHYATLLRGTVERLLPEHDVYITDWQNARDVPLEAGDFGMDDYITHVKDFIQDVGPNSNVVAVCQPTVPVLAAVALLAQEDSPFQPATMTMMGGPIDSDAAATVVDDLAEDNPIEYFERNMLSTVPPWYKGAGRKVFPGFMALTSFVAMNPTRHMESYQNIWLNRVKGEDAQADKSVNFYDEYNAVLDNYGRFYLETIQEVFKDEDLAKGKMHHFGKPVDPAAITETALLTVEGARDDISPPGQTTAAQKLCSGLPAEEKFHYLEEKAGHYGIFNGSKWRDRIAPRLTGFIRDAAERRGLDYDQPETTIKPDNYKP